MLLALVALAAAPVHIETLGFSVEVQGDTVNVVEVKPGSSAELAGVTVGVHIERVFQPIYAFARGPLAKLSEENLQIALTTSHDEPLVFMGALDGKKKSYTLNRTDPRPPPLTAPLTGAQLRRLSLTGQALYYAKLPALMAARPRVSREPLSYSEQVSAQISPEGVHRVIHGAATPDWIYLDEKVSFLCPGSPMRSIELVSVAPVPKVLATSEDKALQGGPVAAQIPMWRVKDAREACKRGESKLPSVEITASVRCEGKPPLDVPFSLSLALECLAEPPPNSEPKLDALRVRSKETVLLGSSEKTKLAVRWSTLRPTPLKATVVELDAKGKVTMHFGEVPAASDEDQPVEFDVELDTTEERKIRIGLELQFPDGSTGLTTLQFVNVMSKAKLAKQEKEFASLTTRSQAVLERMGKQFKDPCAAPDETVAWLRKQPEVGSAGNFEGHNLSFTVGSLPFMVHCHHE